MPGIGPIFWQDAGSAVDIDQVGSDMKWLTRFASSQKNIDCVAKWLAGAIALLALTLQIVIFIAKTFK